MKQSLRTIGEFGLIERVKKIFRSGKDVVCGIGDDAAVYTVSKTRCQLLAVDTIVDGVDFDLKNARPEEIGRKALAINLSDIAAMGGIPKMAVVSLTLPVETKIHFMERFARGMNDLARQYNISIVGGDLSKGSELSCTVAITGEAERNSIVYRKGAKDGDLICVTGCLGGSILGKHFKFTPRVTEGQFLAEFGVTAMIDISDGLIQDLNHLATVNRLGYVLDEKNIPVSAAAEKLARKDKKSALNHALYDGEDFELLFTVSRRRRDQLFNLWKRLFHTPLTVIGEMVANKKSKPYLNKEAGYSHF